MRFSLKWSSHITSPTPVRHQHQGPRNDEMMGELCLRMSMEVRGRSWQEKNQSRKREVGPVSAAIFDRQLLHPTPM